MKLVTSSSLLVLQGLAHINAFSIPSSKSKSSFIAAKTSNLYMSNEQHECDSSDTIKTFDPLNTAQEFNLDWSHEDRKAHRSGSITNTKSQFTFDAAAATAPTAFMSMSAALMMASAPTAANARGVALNTGDFNPDNFRPVCPASDGVYRFAQSTTQNLVGPDNFVEYGPLIAGGLLRVRLELCVVESFFNEAVGPFIEREGLRWVLPLHETVETFLAGTIFALASTFILVGSTKIVSVLITYGDVFLGAPLRLFGGFVFDRARGKPVTLDIGFGPFKTRVVGPGSPKDETKEETLEDLFDFSEVGPKELPIVLVSGAFKTVGETSKITRQIFEGIDLFVGRYLTLIATGYIGLKFVHFKIFPDFPPF